jgi:hypothetical protein
MQNLPEVVHDDDAVGLRAPGSASGALCDAVVLQGFASCVS